MIPHSQLDQQPADGTLLADLLDEARSWPGASAGPSQISVPGACALLLDEASSAGPAEAFLVPPEFCHGHAQGDHSLHLTLPVDLASHAESAGWAEPHFLALTGQLARTVVMLYAPRDGAEAAVALDLVRSSYDFARGATPPCGQDLA